MNQDQKRPEASISELINAIEGQINSMSVAEIAEKTGKSERSIKAYLSRHEMMVKDYDGTGRKSKVINENPSKPEQAEIKAVRNPTNVIEAISSFENESRNRWNALGWIFAIIWIGMTFWGFSTHGLGFFLFWIALSVVLVVAFFFTFDFVDDAAKKRNLDSLSKEDKDSYLETKKRISEQQTKIMEEGRRNLDLGCINPNLVCPHCQTKGHVRSKSAEEITRTKVVPVVGNTIQAKKKVTQMHCDNCATTWNV